MSTTYPDLPLTLFPSDGIDSFTTWLNITASDGPLIQQYLTAMQQGNTTQAQQILSQIPNATQKILQSTSLNQLTQAMLALERFFNTDIMPTLEEMQGSWVDMIGQFAYKGLWSGATAYEENNLVSYTVQGATLMFLATSDPPTGTVPTNTNYWRVLTIQGIQGPSGEGLSYRQEWSSGQNYYENDVVTYNGALWQALQANVGVEPGQAAEYWQIIMSLEATTYPIQDTEPTNQNIGALWLNTQDNPIDYYNLAPLTNPAGASQIVTGYRAYSDEGNVIVGTFEGVELEPLSNPATSEQILAGFQAYDDQGNLITGVGTTTTSATFTLTTAGWSNNTQTVTVNGILADETAQLIMPMPAVASQVAYMQAGIYCSGQAANSLTFTCSTVPTENISMYVAMTEV